MTATHLHLRMLAVLCAIGISACQPDIQQAVPANAAAQAATSSHEAGRKIYNFRCYYCHGYSGDARTLATTYLSPRPMDFTADGAQRMTRTQMIAAIRDGRAGTAMAGFLGILTQHEIEQVADFVREEFMVRKALNTRYHTAENGWPAHERYLDAFPFARGEIGVDTPWEQLDAQQAAGKRLYLTACVSCHDRGRATEEPVAWELRAVSYPRNQDSCSTCHSAGGQIRPSAKQLLAPHDDPGTPEHPQRLDNVASPHAAHDKPPQIAALTPQERHGEGIYQKNCAFCHAADGTGRNWIGAFLEPHPRDLTDARVMAVLVGDKLLRAIREGVPGSSMPAWQSVLPEQDIAAIAAYVSRAFYPGTR